MDTGGSFPGVKAGKADHSSPTIADVKKHSDQYIHFPMRLHGLVLN
jgi:hypothetical protein